MCIEYVDAQRSVGGRGASRAKALCDERRRASVEDGEKCDSIANAYDVHRDVTEENHPPYEGDMPAARKSVMSYTMSSIKDAEDSIARSDPYDDSAFDDENFIEISSSVRHRLRRAGLRQRSKRSTEFVDDASHATKSQSLLSCEAMDFCDIESAPV